MVIHVVVRSYKQKTVHLVADHDSNVVVVLRSSPEP